MSTDELPQKGQPPPYDDGAEASRDGGVRYQSGPAQPQMVVPVVVSHPMGPKPTPFTCPSCNQQVVTRVEHKSSTKTHLFALLLCIICCPCVCVPYCVDSCQNADHYCPNCSAYIGSYKN